MGKEELSFPFGNRSRFACRYCSVPGFALLFTLLSQILLFSWTADFMKPSPVANRILSSAYSVCVTPTERLICWVIVALLLPVVCAPAMLSLSQMLVQLELSTSCMSWQAVPCSSCSFALLREHLGVCLPVLAHLNLKSLICWQPLLSVSWDNVFLQRC